MNKASLRERLNDANKKDETILAICLAERLVAQGDVDKWVFEVYARSLIGIGRYGDASNALERAESLAEPEDIPWILDQRAALAERRGDFETALEYWKSAHARRPDEASFLIFAASVLFRMGSLSGAEDFARRATQCTEGHPDEAWYNLGGYLAAQQRYDEALTCYERAIEIDPDYELAIGRRNELLRALSERSGEQSAAPNP